MTQDRIPPQNMQAERAILGCQILDGSKSDLVRDAINLSDFYSDIHRTIQRAIWSVCDATGGKIDLLMLAEQMPEKDLNDIGGPGYLLECLESIPHAAHVLYYVEIVLDRSRLRKAIAIAERIVTQAYSNSVDTEDLIHDAFDSVSKMADALRSKSSAPRLLSEHASDVIAIYRRGESTTMFWGIPQIDEFVGGYAKGSLIIVGASPRHGKSMVALQWLDCAAQQGIAGMMVSEEMLEQQLARRTLRYISELTEKEMKSDPDRIQMESEKHFKNRAGVLVVAKCATIGKAERAIARAVQSHKVQIVAIDYAQLITGIGDTEEQRIASVSKAMKNAAIEHNIVVILLAQLNRKLDERNDATPRLSDLKGSGGLGADADIVLLPFWPAKFDEEYEDKNEYRIHLAKNRDGASADSVLVMRVNGARQMLYPVQESLLDPTDRFN